MGKPSGIAHTVSGQQAFLPLDSVKVHADIVDCMYDISID